MSDTKSPDIATHEEAYKGWDLFAWEFKGSWRVIATIVDRKDLTRGTCYGGGDKAALATALDDARRSIDGGDVRWVSYKRVGTDRIVKI